MIAQIREVLTDLRLLPHGLSKCQSLTSPTQMIIYHQLMSSGSGGGRRDGGTGSGGGDTGSSGSWLWWK